MDKVKKPFKVIDKKYSEKHGNYVKFNAAILEQILDSFGIIARVVEVNNRPTDIEFALEIALGTRISDIVALNRDLAMALAVPPANLEIEAPIPGRSLIAIRIPYINYGDWNPPKYLPPEEKKEEDGLPEVKKREDLDEIWRVIRAYTSLIFYLIARLFSAIANFIYPERKNS